jgi:hypothetical protein
MAAWMDVSGTRRDDAMANGSGPCREFFVIGYIQMADGQHASIHAQTEIYPGRWLAPVLETRMYKS